MRSALINKLLPLVVAASAALATACSSDDNASTPSGGDAGGRDSGAPAATSDIVDTAVGAGDFKTLVAAVQAAGLERTLRGNGPFTVFAPPDAAFAKLPEFLLTKLTSAPYKTALGLILKYHVVSGNVRAADVLGKTQEVDTVAGAKLTVDGSNNRVVLNGGSTVTTADVGAKNGVIHAIDTVLLPTIVDTAVNYDDGTTTFKTLVQAVTAADLGGTLSGPGTFTVFAPTDAAFAALKQQIGDAAFNQILANKEQLATILKYHVVGSTVFSPDVTAGTVPTLANNRTLNVTITGGTVKVNDANVVLTDLPNRNGVIHVIDKVLVPQ